MIETDPDNSIQSLVFTGFGSLPHTSVVRLHGVDPAWLRRLLPRLCFGRGPHKAGVQLLLSAAGLTTLGATPQEAAAVSREFFHGMTHPPSSQRIGDRGSHAPAADWWTDKDHEAVLLLYGETPEALDALATELANGRYRAGTSALHLPPGGREHFGFLDSITRAKIAKCGQKELNTLPAGTFVFGRRDAAGTKPEGGPLARDGSLVVLRELGQDVRAFWHYWLTATRGDGDRAIYLAAKAVGRWPNGMPVLPDQEREPPYDEAKLEIGSFEHDRDGVGCPFGSHIRRANPRDGLLDSGELSRQISADHTILRRGRVFGLAAPAEWYPEPLRPHLAGGGTAEGAAHRGLFFIGLCADIRRQFEFVMQNWLLAPKFADLYNEIDPLLAHAETPREFSIPTRGFCQHYSGVGGWVRPQGGGYYLLPGRDALERLAAPAPTAIS